MSPLLKPLSWNRHLAHVRANIDWLWPGLLARRNLTLLTGGWKSGKTTLVSLLLDRRNARETTTRSIKQPSIRQRSEQADCPLSPAAGERAGVRGRRKPEQDAPTPRKRQTATSRDDGTEDDALPMLLNRAVRPGATVVVSEEDESLWLMRQRRLDFGPDVGFWRRPFAGRPTPRAWKALIDELLHVHQTRRVDLVVIDPLAMFLPGNENNPSSLLAALDDLHRLTHAGLAVLLLHHPAKGEPTLGQAARGTGALSACADILLELRVPPGDPATRRRRLFGFSRYAETPRRLSIELTPDATDYAVCADAQDDEPFRAALRLITLLLCRAPAPMTRQQLLAAWPIQPPDPSTLWRWLSRATTLRLLTRTGAGTKRDAYRYKISEESTTSC